MLYLLCISGNCYHNHLVINPHQFDKSLSKKLKKLDSCVQDQSKFNQLVADIINNLDFEDYDQLIFLEN